FNLFVLCFLLIDAQDEETPCLLDKRYRSFHKYEYLYEAESLNSLNGAINGPRASCKVEIEVPGTCHYVVHMKECTLSEVTGADADGNPVFRAAAGADTFKIEMEKNPLKVIVEGDNDIKLFPEDGELINILNIKRGIISALAVPVLEEERNKRMPTVFGLCKTDYTVNAREDIATDVTITRDLSRCDNFRPIKDHTSPLALITGMHYPLAQLFRSKQTCNYKFDNQQKHMTSGDCTETHLLVPFSHKGRYGVMNVGKQTVSLLGVTEHNERVFDYNEANMKPLHLDVSVDMSPNQDADAILTILRELAGLSQTTHGNKRAHLAQRLVAVIRKSNADTLSAALPEALDISRSLTYQALFQCGTPACSSAMLKVLRTIGSTTAEIDAAVYAMGLVPNPSRALVKEMLEMARFKPTKLIYYATSNAVRRLYKAEGRVTPEIEAVADYFTEETGDCTGDQEHIYLTLRVIGNMAAAVGAASPDLKSAVIKCINQPAASPKVQQAAIQVFRLTPVPEEVQSDLMQVLLNGNDPVQKRIAAYLILMKDPQPAELDQLAAALRNERNLQAKSFFISHITNILSSTAPETKELRQKILDALQGNEVEKVMDPTKFSRHYKIGSLVGNMIFEKANKLPKEVMLEMTLNAFGYDIDMFEVGVEGKGLEPTVEALFGPRGFFPDTAMKTIFFAMEKMPSQVNEASQNIIRDISQNVEKLIKDLKAQDTPEAMLYLRLLGAELGYLQIKDMEELAYSVAKVVENLLKMFPTDFIKGLFSSVDNELFLHYIFMDNEFYLPTGPGVPLRVALSGTFAPGVKGGLKIARDMSEIAFMPSVGVEFVAEIGAHLPDYVHSGLEMHTNIYHESGLSAKVALAHNQIKVTIPAPDGSSKLLSITNTLLSVAGDDINIVPAMEQRVNAHECRPLFSGLKQCSSIDFSDAWINDASPYFPLSGDSKYEIELRPTGEVSEYTATIKYTNEDMVDKVTVDVEAEGTLTKATAMMMFNRKDYTVSADLQIPEYLNVGLRIVTADPHSITIDLLSNDVSQASLVGLAKIDTEKAMLQVQLLVPSLQADAKITTSLKYADDLTLEFESDLRLPETTSVQKLILTYGTCLLNNLNSSIIMCAYKLLQFEMNVASRASQISDLLNQQIGQTEMKVLHVLTSAKLLITCIAIIVTLVYLNRETGANYHFGKDYYTITFPMPLGGKSSKDLNFPPALTTPNLAVPQLGLQISSIEVPLPEILVPETFTVSLPSLGMAEVSGKLSSNLYDLEATASAGRQSSEQRSYSASVEVIGTCPVDILSLRVQGEKQWNCFFQFSIVVCGRLANLIEYFEVNMVKEISIKSSSKFDATGPLGIEASLEHTGQVEISTEEISGDSNLKGTFVTGPVSGGVSLTQSLALFPFRPKARIQSDLKVDSTLLQAQNTFTTTYANGELSVLSNTDAFGDVLTHTAEVTIRKSTFAVKSDAKALALGLKIQNIAEVSVSAGDVNIKFETTTDHPEDYIRSLITATLNADGLAVNSNAAVKLAEHTATHKASLALNKNGLATNGTTFLNSPLVLKNTFSGVLDSTKASFSVKTKSEFVGIDLNNDISMSATTSTVDLVCKSQGSFDKYLQYVNDVHVHGEPYSAAVNINNDLTILAVKINNEAMFKAEPYKADLTGTLKLALDADELKHTYEISYADLIATAKCSTTAKLMGAHMSHDTEMEIAGLGVRINNNANFNSQPVRFTTTLQATAVPFSFNLNALANGDGELNLFGKQSAQVYTKFLLKAEPLAFAHSHECRVSTKHELNSDVIIETNFDKKVDTVLTPFEQLATIRVKSKINNNEISQDVSAYNNPERIGVEASGVFISGEIQDVSLSGFLKYEKNTESHAINLPFIESLPEVLENIKITAVLTEEFDINTVLLAVIEAFKDMVNLIAVIPTDDVNKMEFFVKYEVDKKIEAFLDKIVDLIKQFKIDQTVQGLINTLKSVEIPVTGILNKALTYLKTTEIKEIIEDLNTYLDAFIQTIQSFDYNAFVNELPKIPTAVVVPTFGKLYSEIRLRTPIYTLRTSAEIQNSTGNEQMHHFTAFLTSIGESSEYPVLNYNLDCTARIGVPRMSRLIIAETLKFIHSALTVEHQASVTFYGLSAQATAQTIMKATTTPYKADIVNRAFFAVEGGMSASLDTTYKHKVDIPFLSMTNEATLTQSAVAIQKDTTISVTVGQIGTGKVNLPDYSEEASYKSDLRYTMDLQNVKFTFTEDFDSATLKIKDTLNVNAVMLSHIDFNGQIETKSSYIKNSLLVASGRAHLGDRKVELEATHDTELVGPLSGTLSNALNIMVRPVEIVIDFQNKGNTKITLIKSLSAKIDLQNDYSVIVNSRTQRINTAALVRFNQYKYGYNFTIDNKESESGIYATANGETDLEFLTVPLSIPEIPVPMLDFSIPAISDLNLYEHSGLKHLLITTKQAIDVDGKIVYQKSKFPPIIDLGFISVPAIGNLNSEVSFKSSIFNLNANAGIHGDDLVIRVAATSTSVHKPLKAKLEGTSGLTLKRGVKLATTVSLENAHFSGNHDSTLTLNTENLEAAVAVSTFAKTKLPILTIDANHNFKTDTKTHLKAESILDIKYTYDLPIIKAVGKGDAEHTFKLDGAFSSISVDEPSHTLNVDITSPTFTDVNLRYAARRDGVSTSVSTPSAGFLGFQLHGKIPSEMYMRLYGRYASALENDIDIFTAKVDATGDEKISVQATYNLEAPKEMILGLQARLPFITSSITNFGEKYGICSAVEGLKTTIVSALTEVFTAASSHAPELSQLSILFRNVVVQYQKAIQNILNAAARFLRETQIKLPGMEETTLPEICKKIKSNVVKVVQEIITAISDNFEAYFAPIIKTIGTVELILPSGGIMTGDQIYVSVRTLLRDCLTRTAKIVEQLESLDMILDKLGDTLQEVVEKAQEIVDNIRSEVIDAVALYFNIYYTSFVTLVKGLIEKVDALLTIDQLNAIVEKCMESVLLFLNELKRVVSDILPAESGALIRVQDGRLELELPFPFHAHLYCFPLSCMFKTYIMKCLKHNKDHVLCSGSNYYSHFITFFVNACTQFSGLYPISQNL
uniref:Vitellogenin domain-containing protein n=1 Tax=Pygocentrus nattereri TaxID=42514 RepID=A0AAR2JHL4_PYGNA